jgi:hypothetical protein
MLEPKGSKRKLFHDESQKIQVNERIMGALNSLKAFDLKRKTGEKETKRIKLKNLDLKTGTSRIIQPRNIPKSARVRKIENSVCNSRKDSPKSILKSTKNRSKIIPKKKITFDPSVTTDKSIISFLSKFKKPFKKLSFQEQFWEACQAGDLDFLTKNKTFFCSDKNMNPLYHSMIHKTDKNGNSGLYMAVFNNNYEAARLLLERGAHLNQK